MPCIHVFSEIAVINSTRVSHVSVFVFQLSGYCNHRSDQFGYHCFYNHFYLTTVVFYRWSRALLFLFGSILDNYVIFLSLLSYKSVGVCVGFSSVPSPPTIWDLLFASRSCCANRTPLSIARWKIIALHVNLKGRAVMVRPFIYFFIFIFIFIYFIWF